MKILITCEHASKLFPKGLSGIKPPDSVLESHRGYDFGANLVAERLVALHKNNKISCRHYFGEYTRLLVDLNRPPSSKNVFSHYSKRHPDLARLLTQYHHPYTARLRRYIEQNLASGVLHLSIHSFTPVLSGNYRPLSIGILFDPGHSAEPKIAKTLITRLQDQMKKRIIAPNQPYKGNSDGLTKWFRELYGDRYLGIEVEINQRILKNKRSGLTNANYIASTLTDWSRDLLKTPFF